MARDRPVVDLAGTGILVIALGVSVSLKWAGALDLPWRFVLLPLWALVAVVGCRAVYRYVGRW